MESRTACPKCGGQLYLINGRALCFQRCSGDHVYDRSIHQELAAEGNTITPQPNMIKKFGKAMKQYTAVHDKPPTLSGDANHDNDPPNRRTESA